MPRRDELTNRWIMITAMVMGHRELLFIAPDTYVYGASFILASWTLGHSGGFAHMSMTCGSANGEEGIVHRTPGLTSSRARAASAVAQRALPRVVPVSDADQCSPPRSHPDSWRARVREIEWHQRIETLGCIARLWMCSGKSRERDSDSLSRVPTRRRCRRGSRGVDSCARFAC